MFPVLLGGAPAQRPVINPASRSDLVVWYKRDTGFFQDTAGATPAVNAGDPVQRWSDSSGNGFHAVQNTAANKCHLSTHAWGTKALWLKGITNWMQIPVGMATTQNQLSVYTRFQYQDQTQTSFVVNIGDGNAHELGFWNNGGLSVNTEIETATGLSFSTDQDNIVSLISGNGAGHVTMGNTSVAISGQAAIALAGGAIGQRTTPAPNKFAHALVMEVIVFNTAHSSAVEAGLRAYLAQPGFTRRFSLDLPLVVFDGNSIVKGSGASAPDKAFVYKTMAGLSSTVQYANLGIIGQKIKAYGGGANQMTENRPTKVDALFDSRRNKNLLVALEMVNSEPGAGSGAVLKADWQAYLAGAKTANSFIQTICYNDAPPNAGSTGADANTALDADFTGATGDGFVFSPAGGITYADREVRVAAMTITRPDTVHPNDAGHLTMATSNIAALSQLGVT
jgi:hypothetical protein